VLKKVIVKMPFIISRQSRKIAEITAMPNFSKPYVWISAVFYIHVNGKSQPINGLIDKYEKFIIVQDLKMARNTLLGWGDDGDVETCLLWDCSDKTFEIKF